MCIAILAAVKFPQFMDAYDDKILMLSQSSFFGDVDESWNPGEGGLNIAVGFKDLNVTQDYGQWLAGTITRNKDGKILTESKSQLQPCTENAEAWKKSGIDEATLFENYPTTMPKNNLMCVESTEYPTMGDDRTRGNITRFEMWFEPCYGKASCKSWPQIIGFLN